MRQSKKLSKCKIEDTKAFLIKTISETSSDKHENKLVEFMDKFKLTDLKNATVEQLQDFCLDDLHK